MSKKFIVSAFLLGLLAFSLPIEHKYDKLFRFYSLTLAPQGVEITKQYDQKIYFYISDIIALILTGIGLFWYRIPLKKWFGNFLWIVWLCALFSIIASPFCNYPIPYFRLLQLFTPIALFAFISNSEHNFTRVILVSIVIAALFQSAIGIMQYFHQGPLGLRLFGEIKNMSSFYMADGSRWFLDQWMGWKNSTPVMIRAQGTFPHANVFGGFIVFSILATYYLRRFWYFTLPLQLLALILSFSRGAIFAWGLATLIWFGLQIRTKFKQLLPLGILFGLIAILFYPQFSHRGGLVNYNQWVQHSDNVRKVQFETGKKIILAHPFFGLGFTQFSEKSAPYFEENTPKHITETAPHNIFVFMACEMGLIALFAFIAFLISIAIRFCRSPFTEESILFAALTCSFLFIGQFDFYPILFQQGKLMFFLACALLVANTKKNLVLLSAYE